jgi:hypothetical protein
MRTRLEYETGEITGRQGHARTAGCGPGSRGTPDGIEALRAPVKPA